MTRVGPDDGGTDKARLEAVVRGRVQGVGFRYFVLREADRLDLQGWVANRPDGGLELVMEGPRGLLERLAIAISEGPPGSVVAGVDVSWSAPRNDFVGLVVRARGHPGD